MGYNSVGDRMEHLHQLVGPEVNIWGEMLGSSNSLPDVETQAKNEHKLNENVINIIRLSFHLQLDNILPLVLMTTIVS